MAPNPYEASQLEHQAPEAPSPGKCPLCSRDMDTGFVVPSGTVFWVSPEQQNAILLPSNALKGTGHSLRLSRLPGLRCTHCNIVLFTHQ